MVRSIKGEKSERGFRMKEFLMHKFAFTTLCTKSHHFFMRYMRTNALRYIFCCQLSCEFLRDALAWESTNVRNIHTFLANSCVHKFVYFPFYSSISVIRFVECVRSKHLRFGYLNKAVVWNNFKDKNVGDIYLVYFLASYFFEYCWCINSSMEKTQIRCHRFWKKTSSWLVGISQWSMHILISMYTY